MQGLPIDDRKLDRDFLRFRDHGAADALARVFDALAPRLLLVAGHLASDFGRAEDLVQSTFLHAIRDAHRYDGARPVAAWLAGILRNRAIDARRRADLRRGARLDDVAELPDVSGAPDPAQLVGDEELYERVVAAVLALDEPYRAVLNLRVVHGLSPTAIAHALGRKPGTVRMQLKRGLEELRRAMPVHGVLLAFGDGAAGLASVRAAVLDAASAAVPPATTASASGAPTPALAGRSTLVLGGILTMKTFVSLLATAVVALALVWIARASMRSGPESAAAPGSDEAARADAGRAALAEPDRLAAEDGGTRRPADPGALAVDPRSDELEVSITFADDDTPASDVGVYLRSAEPAQPAEDGPLGVDRRTDAAGIARFAPTEPGTYEIYVDRVSRPVLLSWPEESSLAIEIPAGLRVTGRVVDLADAGVPGAVVYRRNDRHHDVLQRVAVADAAGRFVLRDVEGELELLARAPRHQPSELESVRERDGHVEVELRLGALGHAVRGRVLLPGGAPAPFAWVLAGVDEDAREEPGGSATDPRAREKPLDREGILLRADADGRFASDEIPGGHVLLLARSAVAESGAHLLGWTTQLVNADVADELIVHLQPGAEITGVVRDARGLPVGGVTLEAEWEGTRELGQMEDELGPFVSDRRTVASADGSYRLAGLLPGDYDLRVFGKHAELLRHERTLGDRERAVWDPVIARPCGLDVRLVGPDGAPLPGWIVAAEDELGWRFARAEGKPTDAEGRARLADLPADRELVVGAFPCLDDGTRPAGAARGAAHVAGLPAAWRTGVRAACAPDASELVLRLASEEMPSAAIRGRLVAADGSPASGARLALLRAGWEGEWTRTVNSDGGFAFEGLAAGELRLRVKTRELSGSFDVAQVTLAIGETLDLGDVVIPATAAVAVEVRVAGGEEVGHVVLELTALGAGNGETRASALVDEWSRNGDVFTASAPPGSALLRVLSGEFAAWCEPVRIPPTGARFQVVLQRVESSALRVLLPELRNQGRRRVWDAQGRCLVDDEFWISFAPTVERVRDLTVRLAPGIYRVRLEIPGGGQAEHELRVPAAGGGDPVEFDLR